VALTSLFQKSKKDENGDLEQSYVKKDESAKGRFWTLKTI
jgi:conjugal transfer pilus assembly protein TraE